MINSIIKVILPTRVATFEEFSFFEYKNICKMLLSREVKSINDCFDIILKKVQYQGEPLNVIEKFLCLLSIRTAILGNEVQIIDAKNRRVNYDLSILLDIEFEDINITYKNLTFKTPILFYTSDVITFLGNCLASYNDINVQDLSLEEKIQIINAVEYPLTEMFKQVNSVLETSEIDILGNAINIYQPSSVLGFLRDILYENIIDIIEYEYICIRDLNLNSNDFKTYTYPELKIFMNYFAKQMKEPDASSNSNSGMRGFNI